jgi:Tol biopolymer transport system component
MDVGTRQTRPLFGDDGACDYAARPGFDPDGDRLVVLCVDESGEYLNTAIVDLTGRELEGVAIAGTPLGTPTWISENSLVYALDGAPSTLWEIRLPGEEREPLTDGTEGWDSHPDWSQDAGLLLFSRHVDERVFGDLLTVDIDRTPGPATDGELWAHPAWAPDGERVVVTVRDDEGVERLGVVRREGDGFSDVQYVPNLPGEPGVPAWGTR